VLLVSDLVAPGGKDDTAYMRVVDDIAARIASGELTPGVRLLSERDLAGHYGVAYGTIRRAAEVLRERGLIETIHGRGTFVKQQSAAPAPELTGDADTDRDRLPIGLGSVRLISKRRTWTAVGDILRNDRDRRCPFHVCPGTAGQAGRDR
jgi:GntR family transcriptional regulator